MILKKHKKLMDEPRIFHSATLLPNGKIFVFGGSTGSTRHSIVNFELPLKYKACENKAFIYDPIKNKIENIAVSDDIKCRVRHEAVGTIDGNVLIWGGSDINKDGSATNETQGIIFNLHTKIFEKLPYKACSDMSHWATLSSGEVLFKGRYILPVQSNWYDYINPLLLWNGRKQDERYDGVTFNPVTKIFRGFSYDFDFDTHAVALDESNTLCFNHCDAKLRLIDITTSRTVIRFNLNFKHYSHFTKLFKISNNECILIGGYKQERGPYYAESIDISRGLVKLIDIKSSLSDYLLIGDKIYYEDHYTHKTNYYDMDSTKVTGSNLSIDLDCFRPGYGTRTTFNNTVVLIGGEIKNNNKTVDEIMMDESDIIGCNEIVKLTFE